MAHIILVVVFPAVASFTTEPKVRVWELLVWSFREAKSIISLDEGLQEASGPKPQTPNRGHAVRFRYGFW